MVNRFFPLNKHTSHNHSFHFNKKKGGSFFPYLFSFLVEKRIKKDHFCSRIAMELKDMMVLVSRSGRHLQRYNNGRRQVVGYVPSRQNQNLNNFDVCCIFGVFLRYISNISLFHVKCWLVCEL